MTCRRRGSSAGPRRTARVKLFVDSANLEEIEAALRRGFASGITTNPSILAAEDTAAGGSKSAGGP
jgi:transaldolase